MMDKVRRFMELKDKISALEADLDELNKERGALEEQIIDEWLDAGCNSVELDGRKTYLRVDTYASTPQGMDAVAALLTGGPYADIVKPSVNKQTLSALVRELDELPPEWEGVIEVGKRSSLRVVKA
ncbi:MAG: hypothetical protein KBI47_14330 [Armatimonadetes bacterium]|nr:hypothetical protein [Armatimonadota bacterium]